jgi:hypothetical protein
LFCLHHDANAYLIPLSVLSLFGRLFLADFIFLSPGIRKRYPMPSPQHTAVRERSLSDLHDVILGHIFSLSDRPHLRISLVHSRIKDAPVINVIFLSAARRSTLCPRSLQQTRAFASK